MHLSRIVLKNVRNLRSIDLPLGPLNVLIGANGCGKSTLLQALRALSPALNRHGCPRVVPPEDCGLAATQGQDDGLPRMEVVVVVGGVGRDVPALIGLRVDFHGGDTYLLLPADTVGDPHVGNPLDAPPGCLPYTLYCPGPDLAVLREPQALDPSASGPRADGSQLTPILNRLQLANPPVYERIEDALRAAFPAFKALDFSTDGIAVHLGWKEEDNRLFRASQLSDGTLRFLYWTVLLLGPERPDVLLLDQPDLGLHPELLVFLAGMLKEAVAHGSQVFVATHSAHWLRWMEPRDLVIFDRQEGEVRLRRGDDPDLNLPAWLSDFTLGEVWLRGGLGGRR